MKKYKRLTCLFAVLAALLSHVMCAAVAYSYCALQWGGQYAGCLLSSCLRVLCERGCGLRCVLTRTDLLGV